MRRDTAWRSMYSDISKRCSGTPSSRQAVWRLRFAHMRSGGERRLPIGLSEQARRYDVIGGNQRVDGVFLTVSHVFQIATEELQHLFVVVRHGFGISFA